MNMSENSVKLLFPVDAGYVADVTGGVVSAVRGGYGKSVSVAVTDSRSASSPCMFIAIPGENFDGHDYILSAVSGGARIILAEREPEASSGAGFDVVVVPDTVRALGALGRAFIKGSGAKTVAVTGSVGKTTTKEFIASCLSAKFRVSKTEGNKNNEIGLPLTALKLEAGVEYAVFECGMSALGEIEYLSNIVRPEIAVITNIGTSHMERLGSRENIARAKLEIVSGMDDDGVLIINADEPLLYGVKDSLPVNKVITAALHNRAADYRAVNLRRVGTKTVFDLIYNGRVATNIEIPVIGTHNVYDALYAFAVGILCGMNEAEIRAGLRAFKGASMRQKIYDLDGITVIEDCYNASPESMRAGIDVLVALAKERGGRAAALLGDMRELGEYSRLLHDQLGVYAARAGVGVLFTYGTLAESIAASAVQNGIRAENVYVNLNCTDPAPTGDMIMSALRPGDVLLVKASRAVAAEAVLEYIKKKKQIDT